MVAQPVTLGPFVGGLNNSAGMGDNIEDDELFDLVNLEVDLDGSLTNRPAVRELALPIFAGKEIRVIGTWITNQRKMLIVANRTDSTVVVLDTGTNSAIWSVTNVQSSSTVQYNRNLWIVADNISINPGGYLTFDENTNTVLAWNPVVAMPRGEAIVIYKSRLFVAAGPNATTNESRLYYSDATTQATWPGFIDIDPGNGQKLVSMVVLNNDIILFKEHSTFRYGYGSDPNTADISKLSGTIGAVSTDCAVAFDNNSVYVLHDNSVYELYNMVYTKISDKVSMTQKFDPNIYSAYTFGLTLYRSRLFVRYYGNMYVYSLTTKTWSRWETTRQFSRLIVIPSSTVGLDVAYAATATSLQVGKIFFFTDDRILGVGTEETFDCKVVTKTYDFDLGYRYKTLFWWDLLIATSGATKATVTVTNVGDNLTWDQLGAYTWDQAEFMPWEANADMGTEVTVGTGLGGYARKSIKLPKKLRFRQAFWTVITTAVANSRTDSSVRIFNIIPMIREKQTVSKETT